jgi:ABC-type transport system involved in multi-copper enzyme maturation permease subunit
MTILSIAADLWRHAFARKWFLVLGVAVTLFLVGIALSLRLDVVDGALAGMRLFGHPTTTQITAVDVALRPIFKAAAIVIYYPFTLFLIVLCAEFAPSLLAAGRIEHMLSLPVRRWELVLGTYLGVVGLSALFALYGAGGLCAILGMKTGVLTLRPVLAALLGTAAFATIYSGMMAAAVLARSATSSAGVGLALYFAGVLAGYRTTLAPMLSKGVSRYAFELVTALLPRISTLGNLASDIAGGQQVSAAHMLSLCTGFLAFAAAVLAAAMWGFERRDF